MEIEAVVINGVEYAPDFDNPKCSDCDLDEICREITMAGEWNVVCDLFYGDCSLKKRTISKTGE